MTTDALLFISDALNNNGIHYEFGEWSDVTVPSPYFVGEFIGSPNPNEDGMEECQFILTGTSTDGWLKLIEADETINGLFRDGMLGKLDNGSSICVWYESSLNVPTDTMDIKRIQINLKVREWKGK